ncbi:MAG: hypothetical protein R2719_05330 [Micropruina sp.]
MVSDPTGVRFTSRVETCGMATACRLSMRRRMRSGSTWTILAIALTAASSDAG